MSGSTQATFGDAFTAETGDESGDDDLDLPMFAGYENKWGATANDTRLFRHPAVEAEWFRDASPSTAADDILSAHGVSRPADELLAEVLDGE